jgi:glucose dehydrogenase
VWLSALQEKDQYGTISAVDLNTGKIAWQVKDGQPMVGGALATAGGLVFTGNKERELLALDARTGAVLWRYGATAGVNAPPMSYMIDGVQYVAVAAGGNLQINSPRGDELLVFSLAAGPNPVYPSPGSASNSPLNR